MKRFDEIYDDDVVFSPEEAQKLIKQGHEGWQSGQKSGNQQLMDDSHFNNEFVRAHSETPYSGGPDGSGFYTLAPKSKYGDQINSSIEKIVNADPFTYDYTTDPLYQQYEKTYRREGDRARQNTMADYSTMTGGLPSSWAVSAAQQAQGYYNQQLADKVPELWQLAYQMYQDRLNNERANLGIYMDLDNIDYNRQSMNADRAYNQYWDKKAFDYQAQRDAINDKQSEMNNALAITESIGYAPEAAASILGIDAGTQTLGGKQVDWGQDMDRVNAAMTLMTQLGYAPEAAAGILGIDPGTQTLGGRQFDFNSNMAKRELALQELKAHNRSSGSGNNNPPNIKFSSAEIEAAEDNLLNGQTDDWTMSALRQKFPNMTDEQILQYYGVNQKGAGGSDEPLLYDYNEVLRTNPNLSIMQHTLDGLSSKDEIADQIDFYADQGMLTREEIRLLAQMYGIDL